MMIESIIYGVSVFEHTCVVWLVLVGKQCLICAAMETVELSKYDTVQYFIQ